MIQNFLDSYHDYTKGPDVPELYHRWCGVIALSVSLGKRAWIPRGPYRVFPNLYVMLMGEPGTGKGTACYMLEDILKRSEYELFAADRSSKEKFLQDLSDGISFNSSGPDDLFADTRVGTTELFSTGSGDFSDKIPKECFILAEEFNDFIGQNNLDFVAWLTKMWSYTGTYRYRLKTGKSVAIFEPCLNILGGNTSSGFALAFPPEIANHGFLARFILVSGEATGVKISFPTAPSDKMAHELAVFLRQLRSSMAREYSKGTGVEEHLDEINQTWPGLDDPRFRDYGVRRFTQLLKLSLCFSAARSSTEISITDVDGANKLLRDTERWMAKALGAFGKSKNADISNKILQHLYTVTTPVNTIGLWKLVSDDLEKIDDLSGILSKLKLTDRIQWVSKPKEGWLPNFKFKEDAVLKVIKGGKDDGKDG